MKLAVLTDPRFTEVLRNLAAQKVPMKVAFKMKKIADAVDKELALYEKTRVECMGRWCEKDGEGDEAKIKTDENGMAQFKSEEDKISFMKELGELGNTDVEIPTLTLDDLETTEISAHDLMVIDAMIEQPKE